MVFAIITIVIFIIAGIYNSEKEDDEKVKIPSNTLTKAIIYIIKSIFGV